MKLFKTGYFDPPWPEAGGGRIKRGADRHYGLMKVPAIKALHVGRIQGIGLRPVGECFEPNSHMYLWATNNFLKAAFEVLDAWGFRYVTCITWGKVTMPNVAEVTKRFGRWNSPEELEALLSPKVQTGLGQYFRGATEHLLFGVRGRVPYRTNPLTGKRAQGRTLVLCPREGHSRKPEAFARLVELVSPGPRLEGFARISRPGWSTWGNEV